MNQEPLLSAFTRLRDNLLSMSRHILQNEDDASDAIQEAASFSLLILFRIGHSLQKASCIASEASSSF